MSRQTRTQGAIVVARVSSEEQVDGTSLDTQIAAGRKKAEQLGLPVVAEFREEGRSGAYLLLRQEMNEAIGLVQSGAASHLITMNLTRFARDSKASQDIKRLVETAGGTLVFTDWEYVKSATGNAQFGMMATFSQWEREQIIERTTRERRNLALKGVQPSRSFRPYGYLVVTKNHAIDSAFPYTSDDLGTYVIIESEAQWVREMFTRYASGASLREICRFLEDSDVSTPRDGAYWRPSTLKRILNNPVYKGLAPFGRHENVYDERRIERGFKITTTRLRAEGEWVSIPCPSLVPVEVWQTCQQRLTDGQERYSGNPKQRHLLSGLLRCPICRRGMHGRKRERIMKGKPATENLYTCPDQRASRNPGGVVCNKKLYDGEQAESVVTRAIIDVANGPELVAAALKAYRQAQGVGYSEAECKRLKAELVTLDRREAATAKAQIEAIEVGNSTAIYVQMLKEIAGKRTNLQVKIDELCAKREQTQGRGVDEEGEIVAATLRDIERALTSAYLTDGEKHDLLARVVEEIIPEDDGDGGYTIKLKPFSGVGTVASILLVGPPGSGKTMLARRIPSILPPLSLDESLDVTKIYSVGGLLGTQTSLVSQRPFRSPHHSISNAALAGGGSVPRPGEVSLSHHGILFLDEVREQQMRPRGASPPPSFCLPEQRSAPPKTFSAGLCCFCPYPLR